MYDMFSIWYKLKRFLTSEYFLAFIVGSLIVILLNTFIAHKEEIDRMGTGKEVTFMNDMLKVDVFINALKACGIKYDVFRYSGRNSVEITQIELLPNGSYDVAAFEFDANTGEYIKEE